eukprot:TRINITY_DN2087_c5_g1_i3.p1 TRINITY_DN2087_c5_g1~~TRINITY_DN2087_c5_g1_i3.p1  ORF type:complete len:212 (+),score=-19.69 TRINITY_DN2087_c5_g1_i3:88-636(+)
MVDYLLQQFSSTPLLDNCFTQKSNNQTNYQQQLLLTVHKTYSYHRKQLRNWHVTCVHNTLHGAVKTCLQTSNKIVFNTLESPSKGGFTFLLPRDSLTLESGLVSYLMLRESDQRALQKLIRECRWFHIRSLTNFKRAIKSNQQVRFHITLQRKIKSPLSQIGQFPWKTLDNQKCLCQTCQLL